MKPDRQVRQERAQGQQAPARTNRFLLVLLAAILLLVAACGDSDSDTASFDEGAEAESARAPAGGGVDNDAVAEAEETESTVQASQQAPSTTIAAAEADEAGGADEPPTEGEPPQSDREATLGSGGASVTPTAADLGRKLIFTAFLNIEVNDVAAASAEATGIIEEMGGFLFGQNTTGGAEASSELTFKVLPDDFNAALERLGTVGELRNQSITTDDVTERIVDLGSRIQVADLGVARLRAALEGAATLEDYAQIERLLLDRESDLELMRGQLRTLQDRVDLATITLVLTQDRVENAIDVRITSYEDHDGGESCPGPDGFNVEAGSDVTICFDITNVGDQTLTNIVLSDTVLEIDAETQLIEVFGSLEELAPGQSALVAHQLKPERSLRLRTRVVAIPTDGVSSEQAGPSVSTQVNFDLRTFDPDTDPGFGDGFSVGVGILRGLWVAFKVSFGFLITLLVLLPFAWLAWRGIKAIQRRMPRKPSQPARDPDRGTPPPPRAESATTTSAAANLDPPEAPGRPS